MARKSSAWTQLQRQREQRAKVSAARERANKQAIRQTLRDRDQAQRRADRPDAADRRREQQEAHDAGAAAATAMKAEVDARVAELQTILASALPAPPQLSFAMLKRSASVPSFDPGGLGDPVPLPRWEDFEPPPPGGLAALMGGRARHARAQEIARAAFEREAAAREQAEAGRLLRLRGERMAYERMAAAAAAEVRDHNAEVGELSKCVPANDVRALAGSVEEKRATAGILVTTAWVGPESKAFAARNNRLRVIEGGELKHLLAEHLSLDVRIDLARRPRRAS
jgi:multidrug efflux pump subunit AcrA (membrane-fusion protein)